MVRPVSSAVSAALLLCACAAPGAAQPLALDSRPFVFTMPDLSLDGQPFDFNLPPDFSDKVNDAVSKAWEKAQDAVEKAQGKWQEKMEGTQYAWQDAAPRPMPNVKIAPVPPMPPMPPVAFGGADAMYQEARNDIDRERYDQALKRLNDLVQRYEGRPKAIENRVDAAMYWKAYTLGKEQQYSDALNTLSDMEKKFSDSRWLKDARALALELQQSSGQAVSPDAQSDDALKLLALRGVMRSDPDRAVPMIERLLAGNSSVNVKENALFVLSQSQSPQARTIIVNTAKSGSNPDLQMKAVRYLGTSRSADTGQTLADVYKGTNDVAVKRAILQAMVSSGSADRLAEIARGEKDVDLRRMAIRNLGAANGGKSADLLRSMYSSETSPDVKKEIINAIFSTRNAAMLVDMARAEKDPAMKKEIVARLSTMRAKEATDYMLELLK